MPALTTRAGKGAALTHNELDANFTSPLTAVSYGTSGAIALDTSSGGYFYPSGGASGTITFTFTNPLTSGTVTSFVLEMLNGGSQTINWPASVDWDSGVPPTLTASGTDILTFFTRDGGTTWYGFVAGQGMA